MRRMTRLAAMRALTAGLEVPSASSADPVPTSDHDLEAASYMMRRADRLSASSSDHLQVVSVIERVSPDRLVGDDRDVVGRVIQG